MKLTLKDLNKIAAIDGLIAGVLITAIGVISFYVLTTPNVLLIFMLLTIGAKAITYLIYIFFALDIRRKVGGFWNFKAALKGIFLMIFVADLFYSVVNFVFYRIVEPNAYEKVSGFMADGITKVLENRGMEDDKIDKIIDNLLIQMKQQYNQTLGLFLKNIATGIIFQFILSLIFAAIFKKEAPVFASIGEDEEE